MGDPVARLLQSQGIGSEPAQQDPVARLLQNTQSDPVARILSDTALASGSSRAPEPGERPAFGERYFGALKEIATHPWDAVTGMAKSVLLDALKLTVPIPGVQGRFTRYPGVVTDLFPELKQEPTLPSVGGAALRTGLAFGLPASKSFAGAAAVGAGFGALSSPEDPALGAALGGTIGAGLHGTFEGAKALGRAAGIKRAGGAPPPTARPAAAPPPPSAPPPTPLPSPRSAIRDLSNADVLDMTPEGIKISAQQAAKEEKALFATLFGSKGARRYRSALRNSTAADASPEAAAKALATLESMRQSLSESQRTALDEVNARGFTSKRLKTISEKVKDYTPENLSGIVDDEELLRMFGDVLMSKNPDRNLSGLYRLRAVYRELDRRGISDNEVLRGVFEYMLGQGIKSEGLGMQIIGKMQDVRRTLSKVVPDKITPDANVTAVTPQTAAVPTVTSALSPETRASLAGNLGPISEAEFQQEAAAIAPRPAAPVDEAAAAAARVEAARTTPFPQTEATTASGTPYQEAFDWWNGKTLPEKRQIWKDAGFDVTSFADAENHPDMIGLAYDVLNKKTASGPIEIYPARQAKRTQERLTELAQTAPTPPPVDPIQAKLNELKQRVLAGERAQVRIEPPKPTQNDLSLDVINNLRKEQLLTVASKIANYNKWSLETQGEELPWADLALRRIKQRLLNQEVDAGLIDELLAGKEVFSNAGPTPPEIQRGISANPLQEQVIGEPLANISEPLTGKLPKEPPGLSKVGLDRLPRTQVLDLEGQTRQQLEALGQGKDRYVFDDEYRPIGDSPKAKVLIKALRYLGEYNYIRGKEIANRPDVKALFDKADQYTAAASRARAIGDEEGYTRAIAQGIDYTNRAEELMRGNISTSGTAVDAIKTFAKDEGGYLDLKRLNEVVGNITDKFKSEPEGKLPGYSQAIQKEIVEGYKPPQPSKVPEGWYAALARKVWPLEKAEKAIVTEGKGKVATRGSPAANIQLLNGWAGRIHYLMKWGGFREVGGEIVPTGTPGFEPTLHSVGGKQRALDRFLLAARVVELDSQGRRLVTNIEPEAARLEVANADPKVVAAGENVVRLLSDVKQLAVDGGLLNERTAAVLDFLGKSYIPLARVIDREPEPVRPSRSVALGVPDPFRKLKGSGLAFVSPRQAVLDYIRRVMRATELNRIANSIVDLAERFPEQTKGWIIERGKNATADPANDLAMSARDLVKMFKEAGLDIGEDSARETAALLSKKSLLMNGDWMRYRDKTTSAVHQVKLDPGLAEIARSLTARDISLLEQFLGLGAQSVRVGVAVLDPVFAVRQTLIDAFHAKMNSRYGFKMGKSTLDAVVSSIRKDKNYRDFFAAGGAYSSFLPAGRGTETLLQSISPKTTRQKIGYTIMNPVDAMARVMDPLIELSKLGEFIAARRSGADVFTAALAAREVAGDLAMAGTKVASLKYMTAFLGPFIAGTEKTLRTAREHPAATMARGFFAISVPSALLWWASMGDDQVRDLQRGELGKNWWFLRLGPTIVRIRKPQLWGQFFGGTMEAALDQMENDNPEGYRRAMEGLARELEPPGLPNLIQTWEGLSTGIDPRTGQSIVPSSKQELDPEFQYGYNTSEFSKRVGLITGFSPAMIDYAIRNLGGSAASAALAGADKAIGYDGVSPPTPVAADLPMLGQLFGRAPSTMAEPLTTFYKNADKASRKLNSMRELAGKFKPDQFQQYVQDNIETIAIAGLYAKTRQDLAKQRQFIEKVRSFPDDAMSRDDKRQLIDQALEQMIELTRAVNDAARTYKKSNVGSLEVAK